MRNEPPDARGPGSAGRLPAHRSRGPATVIDGSISPPWAGTRLHPVTDVEATLDAGPFLNHQGVGGHDSRTEERR
jgi:hypothetical protein